MDLFLQNYKSYFKPLISEYGFKNYKNAYYRVINDVAQYFVLHRWVPFGRSCTIEFNVFPLCMGLSKKSFLTASKDIVQLIGTTKWWDYDPNNEESVVKTITQMYTVAKEYLIPFFEKATDSAAAFDEICKLEKKIYTDIPEGIIKNDYSKICFAIKLGNYDKAIEFLKVAENQYLYVDTQTLENLDKHEKEQYLRRIAEELSSIRREIECLSKPDMDYIGNFIKEGEENTLKNLNWTSKR